MLFSFALFLVSVVFSLFCFSVCLCLISLCSLSFSLSSFFFSVFYHTAHSIVRTLPPCGRVAVEALGALDAEEHAFLPTAIRQAPDDELEVAVRNADAV